MQETESAIKSTTRRRMTNAECRMTKERRSPDDEGLLTGSFISLVCTIMASTFDIRASSFSSSIAFAHYEVQTAEDGGHVADQTAGQKLRQDTEVHEGR